MIKYKVKEVADDFNVKSKVITDILSKKLGVTKKAMTALEPDELNVIFDILTQDNAVADFSEYFKMWNRIERERKNRPLGPVKRWNRFTSFPGRWPWPG